MVTWSVYRRMGGRRGSWDSVGGRTAGSDGGGRGSGGGGGGGGGESPLFPYVTAREGLEVGGRWVCGL